VSLETSNLVHWLIVPHCRWKIFPERDVVKVRWPILELCTLCKVSATANARDFKFCTRVGNAKSSLNGRGRSGSSEQFLHCGLRKFHHNKSSVYRWYPQHVHGRFVYDTYKTMKTTRLRHGWVHMFITHRLTLTLQLYNFDLFRTCRTSSSCTVAWQLARFQLTRCIARSLGDSWASCEFCSYRPPGWSASLYPVVFENLMTCLITMPNFKKMSQSAQFWQVPPQ